MAKYYYNKYSVYNYPVEPGWTNVDSRIGETTTEGYENYSYSRTDGFSGITPSIFLQDHAKEGYVLVRKEEMYLAGIKTESDGSWTRRFVKYKKITKGSYQGSYIEKIIAENGTYPANGKHTDGYWYVIDSIVTPGTPTSITVPTIEIKGGATIAISWGTSSNSDSFRLERRLNGGSWIQVYNGTSTSFRNTIPKGTTSVVYRVRGAIGTVYSSYRTSSTITVKNFPEMGIRINSVLKTSDAGWVRVGGQLKEIDTIWVRVNGAIKEVQ